MKNTKEKTKESVNTTVELPGTSDFGKRMSQVSFDTYPISCFFREIQESSERSVATVSQAV